MCGLTHRHVAMYSIDHRCTVEYTVNTLLYNVLHSSFIVKIKLNLLQHLCMNVYKLLARQYWTSQFSKVTKDKLLYVFILCDSAKQVCGLPHMCCPCKCWRKTKAYGHQCHYIHFMLCDIKCFTKGE